MQKVFIVGTIHGHTPPKELKEVLESLNLDQLLIELPEDALVKFSEYKDIRSEMMYAYTWANEKEIPICLFDAYQPLFNDGMSVHSPEYTELMSEAEVIIDKYSWKDFNSSDISNKLDTDLYRKLFDPEKVNAREECMFLKIKECMIPGGNIVIITGTSHLDFFKDKFPNAILPLRLDKSNSPR